MKVILIPTPNLMELILMNNLVLLIKRDEKINTTRSKKLKLIDKILKWNQYLVMTLLNLLRQQEIVKEKDLKFF
jgi:hypothetical protein